MPREINSFVLTVGATANQNGTALYEGVTVLFLAQLAGVHLTLGQQLMVVYMAILGGIGTAGVPSGSIPFIIAGAGHDQREPGTDRDRARGRPHPRHVPDHPQRRGRPHRRDLRGPLGRLRAPQAEPVARVNISHKDTKITKNDTKHRDLCAFLCVLCAFVADVAVG